MKTTTTHPDRESRHPTSRLRGLGTWLQRNWPLLLSAGLIVLSIYIRYSTRELTNSDMEAKVLVWYAKLQRHGPLTGLGKDFYNYTPPYVYLLALATYTSTFLAPLTAVKLIATAFDVYCGIMIFLIVRLHRPHGLMPLLATAVFFAGPTFLTNSAVWGQADSTFAAFMLTSLFLLLTGRPVAGVAFFSVGLAVKPQGVFFVPLLLVFTLWGRVRWYHFLLVPIVYALAMAPAVAMGRTWYEVFTAYTSQAGAGRALTHNAANIYVFVPREAYDWLRWPAVGAAAGVFLAWVWYTRRHTFRRDFPGLVLVALVSVTLVPFLLPNMRERYYYLGDVLSLILAFMLPAMWYFPVLFQVFSMLSYSMFLWEGQQDTLRAAALLSAFTLVLLLRQQFRLRSPDFLPSDMAGQEAARSDHSG